MTVREFHIEIDQSTQLVAANRSRRWYPEEKDWVLNKIQERFIRSKLRPKKDAQGNLTGGFQLDQAGGDDIRGLVVTNHPLVPYIVDSEKYKCFLPPDYSYLLSDGSRTKLICDSTVAETTANHTHTRSMLKLEQAPVTGGPYYAELVVDMPDKTVTIPDDLPSFNSHVGYTEKADISFLTPWILWKSGTWYWERYDELYKPGWFIQVQNTTPGTVPAITVDGVGIGDIDGADFSDPVVNTKIYSYHTATGKLVNNRLSPTDILRNLRQSRYFGTAHYSPLSELTGDLLLVYRDDNFIVSGVEISYIRKPQPISLSLNTDCELPEGVHRLICDYAVEYLQGRAKDLQGVQMSEADLIKRVVL